MYIFVYGTLRKHGRYHSILEPQPLISSQAWTEGTIYDSGKGYPYFVQEERGRVYGEVYEISPALLKKLDHLESYSGDELKDEYQRRSITIHTDHLGKLEVWTYINKKDQVNGLVPLEFGDWIVHQELDRKVHTYFAYGSCMDDERFKLAQVDHLFIDRIGGAIVDRLEMNYSLSVHDGGRANIIETGNKGEGVLYRVNEEAVSYLFNREGVHNGTYRPAFVDVEVNGEKYEKSLTFIVLNPGKECAPPMHYATEIIRGSYGVVSDEYHKKLIRNLKEKFNLTVPGDE
ncbi:gamma-glutamylcyclotransferase [Jeotgalibacillus sp. S-D1]|uniref:gamma-glutamylcyclotransferase n=1 Tax=Jeotgalibacillus sp. S-D1 TaxID=2552189 RepID=UPI00105A72E3|nr:gamma-glutamylcyclotransferase family protein [Jeotgalibacillus sp. S-D1]TDL34921.1 gamma-glutamylcyclotransferase [Jeotgalibacillus sp. S-D1]